MANDPQTTPLIDTSIFIPWCAGPCRPRHSSESWNPERGGDGEDRHIVSKHPPASHHSHRLCGPGTSQHSHQPTHSVFIPSSAGASLHEQLAREHVPDSDPRCPVRFSVERIPQMRQIAGRVEG